MVLNDTALAERETKIFPSDDIVSPRFPIYTRANTGEVFTVASSPFTWSLFGRVDYEGGFRDALIRMGAFTAEDFSEEGPGRCVCVASFGGYIYISVSISRILGVRAPGMTPEAIDQSFFGEHPDVRPYRAHPDDEDEERSAATGAWMNQILTAPDADAVNRGHRQAIEELVAARPDLTKLSNTDLVARARWLAEELRPVFATHMVNLYGATIISGTISAGCRAAGRPDLESKVISGFGDVDSARQSFELWSLSRIIRSSPTLTAEFDKGLDGLSDRLLTLSGPDVDEFFDRWDAFMLDWGFIGPSVWELRSATYGTEPSIVLHMLEGARKVADEGSPQTRTASFIDERASAIATVIALLEGTELHGPFQAAAAAAQIALPGREGSKVLCTRLVDEARITMRELGQRFVRNGQFEKWTDILLLLDSEIDDFLANPAPWEAAISDRRATLLDLEGRTPPFIIDSEYPSIEDFVSESTGELAKATVGETLTGLGVSPGTHTGYVKVVESIEDDVEIEPGDILVANTTDSSWGALFLSAGALIAQTGAPVSHAAIVSRELGIPASVSVPFAMQRLVTGMKVSVDGNTGVVEVLEVP
ncbi:PEP-utilizing enzyme [Arthrobacter sp. B6]|uniref:PEP-utilizing enzyme n=1 Tax=Arthrobacter sp. B6 TaxID=1570137 RepID=UPI00082F3BCD|nr:PEP-utilizing enzyme [Arthrobacter sp. B6]